MTDNESDFRDLLIEMRDEFRSIGAVLQLLSDRMTRVESEIKHLSIQAEKQSALDTRVVKLEEKLESVSAENKGRIEAMRWWMTLVVAIAAVAVPTLTWVLPHIQLIR